MLRNITRALVYSFVNNYNEFLSYEAYIKVSMFSNAKSFRKKQTNVCCKVEHCIRIQACNKQTR